MTNMLFRVLKNVTVILILNCLLSSFCFSGVSELKDLVGNYLLFCDSQVELIKEQSKLGVGLGGYSKNLDHEIEHRNKFQVIFDVLSTIERQYVDIEALIEQLKNTSMSLDSVNEGSAVQGHQLWKELDQVVKGMPKSEVAIFEFFLEKRMSFISTQFKGYELFNRSVMNYSGGSLRSFYAPTRPNMFSREVTSCFLENTVLGTLAQKNFTEYQILNFGVRELIRVVDFSELSEKTRLLIRSAVSIHSFLNGNTEDFGYIEDAFIRDDRNPERTGDLEYYNEYVSPRDYFWPSMALGACRAKAVSDQKMSQWNAYLLKGMLKSKHSSGSPLIAVERPKYPLPEFEYRGPKSVKQIILPDFEPKSESLGEVADGASLADVPRSAEKAEVLAPQVDDSVHKAVVEKGIHQAQATADASLIQIPLESVPSLSLEAVQAPSIEGVPSRHTRKFHSAGYEKVKAVQRDEQSMNAQVSAMIEKLKANQIIFLKNLFEHKLNVVTFSEFKKTWTQLNGENSVVNLASGGSHLKLKNQKGEIVGGVFAHSDSQEWHRTYHGVLRDAFSMIGMTAEAVKGL